MSAQTLAYVCTDRSVQTVAAGAPAAPAQVQTSAEKLAHYHLIRTEIVQRAAQFFVQTLGSFFLKGKAHSTALLLNMREGVVATCHTIQQSSLTEAPTQQEHSASTDASPLRSALRLYKRQVGRAHKHWYKVPDPGLLVPRAVCLSLSRHSGRPCLWRAVFKFALVVACYGA